MVLKVLSGAFGSSDASAAEIKLEDYNVGMRKHSATAMQAICCTQPQFQSVPTWCRVTLQDKINTGSNLLLIGTANPPVVAAEVASDVVSLPSSAASSGFCESPSICVLQSRLKTLDTTWGRVCSEAAPVWSSERLFAANADKDRPFNYRSYTHIYSHPNICPTEFFPWLFWIGAILGERWYAFLFKNLLSIWGTCMFF